MVDHRIISSDSHVVEPPDLWTSRMEPRFRDRAPRIVRNEKGGDWWYFDGQLGASAEAGTQAGMRFEAPEKMSHDRKYEDVPLGGYIPDEHVKDMNVDGVDVSVLYATVGLPLYRAIDSGFLTAMLRAYNDWLAEFCQAFPKRLKGIAMLNVDDVLEGVRELERCAGMGLTGAMIPLSVPPGKWYDSPEYEPLWAAAQDLAMPLSLHTFTNRTGSVEEEEYFGKVRASITFATNNDHWPRTSLAHMILSGVFERHPKLQVGSIEFELSWGPHFLDRLDYNYTQRIQTDKYRYGEDALPSDYFHRNVFMSFQEDALSLKDRHIIGVDNILWGSDYPHVESTFPRSRDILEDILADCTDEEKAKIVGGNAARIYRLD